MYLSKRAYNASMYVHDQEHGRVMLILRIIKRRPRSCNPNRHRRRRDTLSVIDHRSQ